jgi:KDO2-lipid IV(A) lauroyltransferase
MAKTKLKTFQRALARYGLFSTAWLFTHTPYWLARGIARILLSIGFLLIIRQKRIARESLTIAFGGQKSEAEIKKITKDCFWGFGWGIVEMLYFMAHPQMVPQKVEYEGMEKLEKAMAQGKGIIAVTAHYGNFPLMMLAFAQKGYKTSSIIRPTRDENLEEYLLKRRTECKLNTVYAIPRRQCVENSLKALRDNGILFVPIDQNFGNGSGVFVEFFGHQAATATGPVV